MAVEHIRRFTCDKCSKVEEVRANEQAGRWSRMIITEPPLSDPTSAPTIDMHLCDRCTTRAYDHYIPEKERTRY